MLQGNAGSMKRNVKSARDLLYRNVEASAGELRRAVKLAIVLLGPTSKRSRAKPRDPAKSARKTTVKELDALCRRVVFARDGGRCVRCGTAEGLLDWAHVLSRRHPKVRHDPENSMVLCRKDHMAWHDRPIEAAEWFNKTFPDRYGRLVQRNGGPGRADNRMTRLFLEAEAKKYGVSLNKEA
jgi:5-methylcytosine-specific restriction endonuclease McrA